MGLADDSSYGWVLSTTTGYHFIPWLFLRKLQVGRLLSSSDIANFADKVLIQITQIFGIGKRKIAARGAQLEDSFRSSNRPCVLSALFVIYISTRTIVCTC